VLQSLATFILNLTLAALSALALASVHLLEFSDALQIEEIRDELVNRIMSSCFSNDGKGRLAI
jgi:hypothetical protein